MKRQTAYAVLIAMFISLLFVEKVFAGAWTVPKYKVWAEQYMKWDYAKEDFTAEGKRKTKAGHEKNARTWEFVMEPKIEYGITNWLTALASVEYKEGHYKEYGKKPSEGTFARKHHGLTNIKFGARLRFIENPFVVSTQTKVFIYPGYGIYHGDDPAYTNQPSIGYGDDAIEQRIMIAKTFNVPLWSDFKLPCYAGAETGYRWRTGPVCNDIPYLVEGGFWPVSWLLLKSELDGYHTHAGTGSIKESYGIWRIGGAWQVFGDSVLRQGDKMFNIEFQYGMVLWGKNTSANQEWILKVQTQF